MEDVLSKFVDYEVFVPGTSVLAFDSHVVEFSCHRHYIVDFSLLQFFFVVDPSTGFIEGYSISIRIFFSQVLTGAHIHDVNSYERTEKVRI